MNLPAGIYAEAAWLGAAAQRKEGWVLELRAEAANLPNGVDAADGTLGLHIWEGRAAAQADQAITDGAITMRSAAVDLEELADRLARQAGDLRSEAEHLRARADALQAELNAQQPAP